MQTQTFLEFDDSVEAVGAREPGMVSEVTIGCCVSVSQHGWTGGLALMIGFDGVLRTGEMLHLRTGHLILMDAVHALSGSAQVLIYLGVTKTGHRDNRLDAVKVECPKLCTVISRFLLKIDHADVPLIPSAKAFISTIKAAMKVLVLQEHNLQLYGVRRGVASSTFARTGSYDFVAERGR